MPSSSRAWVSSATSGSRIMSSASIAGAGRARPPRLVDLGELDGLDVRDCGSSSRRSMSSSRSNSSVCACIETYSPAAIETAPAIETGEPGQAHDPGCGAGAGHAEDERHVRHQPVATPRTPPARADAALDVAVVVLDRRLGWRRVTAMPGTVSTDRRLNVGAPVP